MVGAVFIYPLVFVGGHPGTALFTFPGMEIRVQYGQESSVFVEHFVCRHVRMVYRNVGIFLECDAVQAGSQSEDTLFDA